MRLVLLLPLTFSSLRAQIEIPNGAPPAHIFDGRTAEWAGLTPAFTLHAAKPGGRTGDIWVRQLAGGLLIAGKVDGPPPDFATSDADLTRKDHVDLWIAPEDPPRFPPIGWINHLDEVTLETEEDCAKDTIDEKACRAWFPTVEPYRRRLARLFVRQYQMSPRIVLESFATPAYREIQKDAADLAPAGIPLLRIGGTGLQPGPDGGYSFEARVPWDAFPPLNTLQLSTLRLMVDVFSAHEGANEDQPFSTSSPTRQFGHAETLNTVSFAEGHTFQIADCNYPLASGACFMPRSAGNVMKIFALVNYTRAYQYGPEAVSPIVESTAYFEKAIPGGAVLCGPPLAYHRGGVSERFEYSVQQERLEARLQPDGGYLVMSGPRSEPVVPFGFIGSGGCGGCPNTLLDIFWLTRQGSLKRIYQFEDVFGNPFGSLEGDVQISPDWRKITVDRKLADRREEDSPTHWESQSSCLQGRAYIPWGKNKNSPPPVSRPRK